MELAGLEPATSWVRLAPGWFGPDPPRLAQVTPVEPGSLRFAQFGITIGSTDVCPVANVFRS